MREREVLERIRAIFDATPMSARAAEKVIVGNGDDGAVLQLSEQTVLSTDMAVEGVHFHTSWSSPEEIGRKITVANLADICAMGGWPEFLLVTVAFPSDYLHLLEKLAEGIALEAEKVGARVIGGDLSQGKELVISMTAIGRTTRPIPRSGARIGDGVVLSHLPGKSAAGLSLLSERREIDNEMKEHCVKSHCAPTVDYQKYKDAFAFLNSATDISDGLIVDASHIASASGVAFEIDSSTLIAHPDFQLLLQACENEEEALERVLTGGEDHVLLGTTSSPTELPGFIHIGRVIAGNGIFVDGKKRNEESGYHHTW
ncbi:MAG: thiamine-phosphate kinase [Actinomycetota bacterium]